MTSSGIAGCLEDLLVLRRDRGLLLGLLLGLGRRHLALVEGQALDLALVLEAGDEVLVLPAHLLGEVAELAEAALGPQAEHLEARGEDHALLLVVGVRDALEGLEAVQRGGAARGLVRDHAADAAPEDLGGGAEVVEAPARVGVHVLAPEVRVLQLVAVERARDVDVLRAHADHVLAVEQLLAERRGQAAQQVAAAVHDDLLLEGHGWQDTCPF
mmetsp:Transcript_9102/g.20621  ORF Transcript_9102/g.20621 Transcript_9102/m.20621 type:complete len:214 (-) Transcript_9102:22-663(-)